MKKTHAKGRLYKRGKKGKEYAAGSNQSGSYYLEYYIHGERVRKRLVDDEGKPITKLEAAEAERDRLMSPYTTKDKAEHIREAANGQIPA